MGVATLNGVHFRIDPRSISWSYTIRANEIKTVGGKVVQVIGASIDDMYVSGSFGVGGWEEQQKFLARMTALADQQVAQAYVRNSKAPAVRFLYPPKKWDFLVYLKSYTEAGQARSVHLTPGNFAPDWQLTFFVIEDNAGLKQIAKDSFIDRLTKGLGWTQNKYNGPLTIDQIEGPASGQATDVETWLENVYGVTQSSAPSQ